MYVNENILLHLLTLNKCPLCSREKEKLYQILIKLASAKKYFNQAITTNQNSSFVLGQQFDYSLGFFFLHVN